MGKEKKKTKQNSERVLLLEKGKRGVFNVLFSKTTVIVLVILLELVLFITFFNYIIRYMSFFIVFFVLIAIAMIVYLVHTETTPEVKLSWIAVVILIPIAGALIYIWIHTELGFKKKKRAIEKMEKETEKYEHDDKDVWNRMQETPGSYNGTASYLRNKGGFSVFDGTDVEYLPSGEAFFEAMLDELEKAEHFIFMEFFIIQEGYMWGRVLDVLERKARAGVEVRLMYDGTCAIYRLPYNYPKKIEKLGIRCKMFSQLRPFISTSYNNRDHRKILVIDGKVAFTGGSNVADEYINRKHPFGQWKDASVKLVGTATDAFTLMFLRMWNIDEREPDSDYGKYLGRIKSKKQTPGFVVPYGDSPYRAERVGEYAYIDIINNASKYVYIMSPYLILDEKMTAALTLAAKKGVDVRIILPHIPDKKYVFMLAKSHYAQLMAAGVKIYEYTPGFIHSKVFLSDGCHAVVGTVNLDYRSLYLHFECAAYLSYVPAVSDIEKDFKETFEISTLVTKEMVKNEKFGVKLAGRLLKIIAPMM